MPSAWAMSLTEELRRRAANTRFRSSSASALDRRSRRGLPFCAAPLEVRSFRASEDTVASNCRSLLLIFMSNPDELSCATLIVPNTCP
jgi:hypothetical protein